MIREIIEIGLDPQHGSIDEILPLAVQSVSTMDDSLHALEISSHFDHQLV